ncbi:MAG: 4-(cytidine 5'-diphospho)-2-C-methyl-D-erythritol kinase [Thermodesulfobacteriota bacterium]
MASLVKMSRVKPLRLKSPGKVNLRLEILGKREDGYHELKTVLQKISLCDTLSVFLKDEKGISITANHPDLPLGKRNLVYQAAQTILKKSDFKGGVHIDIKKEIPLGAGLGGGSSNAAATLKALNQLLEMGLGPAELMRMGVEIGADVPFFLFEGAAIGTGIGERLRKIELPIVWYLLLNPCFEVSTRWAYQNFILTKRRFHFNLRGFVRTPEEISRLLWNDLECVVSHKYPQIDVMKKLLLSAGALGAVMTGSGPTVFGVFSGKRDAKSAFRKLEPEVRRRGWTVLMAHSLST